MKSNHSLYIADSKNLKDYIQDKSVDLVITSPCYPMIKMWDEVFSKESEAIKFSIDVDDGNNTFESIHSYLDRFWEEINRITKGGAFACINIGDATRTFNKKFALYPNHSRIIDQFRIMGWDCLPSIIWKKVTNSPNKFMGSGMLPAGAYVTLEHEYILIFRKGKREFSKDDKIRRRNSAYFWEERNEWFSDIWSLKGVSQKLKNNTRRSAAFPFELAYRLINMYSIEGDIVCDPFTGTGTSIVAAMASNRNSVGIEIDKSLESIIRTNIIDSKNFINKKIENRLNKHREFARDRFLQNRVLKYQNLIHGFPVLTKQETDICLRKIELIKEIENNKFEVEYTGL